MDRSENEEVYDMLDAEPATEDDAKLLVKLGYIKPDSYIVGEDGGIYFLEGKEHNG